MNKFYFFPLLVITILVLITLSAFSEVNNSQIQISSSQISVIAHDATAITDTSAVLRGEIAGIAPDASVEVKFKYREVGIDFQETWWIGADTHIGRTADLRELNYLKAAVDDVNELGISDYAIILGDLVEDDPQFVEPFVNAMNNLDHDWTYVIGNHDFDRHGTGERVMDRVYFNKVLGGVRFLAFSDDGMWNNGDVKQGYQTEKNLKDDQNDWLRTQLLADPEKPTILMSHQGLRRMYEVAHDDGPDIWDRSRRGWLQDEWDDYNIPMWYRGHRHAWAMEENYMNHGFVDISPGGIVNESGGGVFMTVTARGGNTTISTRFRHHLTQEWITVGGFEEHLKVIETGLEPGEVSNWKTTETQTLTGPGRFHYVLDGLEKGSEYEFKVVLMEQEESIESEKKSFIAQYTGPSPIYNWHDLNYVRDFLAGDYILKTDINEQAEGYAAFNIDKDWQPIGEFSDAPFTGRFDGNGHVINGLTINQPDKTYLGLFGYVDNAEISNLGVSVNITGDSHIGAIAGRIDRSLVTNSYSLGVIESDGTLNIGGMFGSARSEGMIISGSWSSVDINHTGDRNLGGLVGYVTDGAVITDSYAHGSVAGNRRMGGLVGLASHGVTITNSYSTGQVSGNGDEVGGLAGARSGDGVDVINSFWDMETSGVEQSDGGKGLSTDEMKTQSTYTDAGWDFTNIWSISSSVNNGYPFLLDNQPDVIEISDWYQLNEVRQILDGHFILANDLDAQTPGYETYNSGSGWSPIGEMSANPFTGIFDGNGHTISDLFIFRPAANYQGLFAYVESAEITNLGLLNVDITANSHAGAIAGRIDQSLLAKSYATGKITVGGDINIGGLAGSAREFGMNISKCWSRVDITSTGDRNVGGIVGYITSDAVVSDSYAHGNIRGNRQIGGLVGLATSGASIRNSYSTGNVSGNGNRINVGGLVGSGEITENSFWDVEASGVPRSAGGTGKTTAEMTTESTFIDASWDFSGTWKMLKLEDDTTGYPILQDLDRDQQLLAQTGASSTRQLLAYAPKRLEFDDTEVGKSQTKTLEVFNKGLSPLEISAVSTDPPEIFSTSFTPASQNTINFGDTLYLEVTFTPNEAGLVFEGILVIDSNDPDNPETTISLSGNSKKDTRSEVEDVPLEFGLDQNYPNPFNPSTVIRFSLPEDVNVELAVYTVTGQRVATLINNEHRQAGYYTEIFDASNLSSGMYIYRIRAGDFSDSKSFIFLK